MTTKDGDDGDDDDDDGNDSSCAEMVIKRSDTCWDAPIFFFSLLRVVNVVENRTLPL